MSLYAPVWNDPRMDELCYACETLVTSLSGCSNAVLQGIKVCRYMLQCGMIPGWTSCVTHVRR